MISGKQLSVNMGKRTRILYRDVYRALRGRILSAAYPPAGKIETERELTRQFHTSVITIRQALQMLVDDGLLEKQHGRGSFVSPAVRNRMKLLGVCGLNLTQGLRHRVGPYFSDLLMMSQQEAVRRGWKFETVWLPTYEPEQALAYCDESVVRNYVGFLFFACSPDHQLLRRVRELRLRYAVISSQSCGEDDFRVWVDNSEAIRLAIRAVGGRPNEPILVMGLDSLRSELDVLVKSCKHRLLPVLLPTDDNRRNFESGAYRRMFELIRGGPLPARIVFLDDMVAQGATRALLKARRGGPALKLAVICGRQEIPPLGFPASFVVHDTQEEVAHAFAILDRQRDPSTASSLSWRSGFRVIRDSDIVW